MIDPAQLKPVLWTVTDPEPLRKLYWFCVNGDGEKWVEVMPTDRLFNGREIIEMVKSAIYDSCGPCGEVLFKGDPQLYYLSRVELRIGDAIDEVLRFEPELVSLDQHLLIRIFTVPALPSTACS